MLYNKPVAGSVGYTSIPMNVGSMTNSGFELDLTYLNFQPEELYLGIVNLNAHFIKNKINKLHPDLDGQLIDGNYIYEEGESMYRMYLVDYAGVDPETGLAQYWAKDEKGELYKTENYALAQTTNKVATDNLMPKVYGGLGTSVQVTVLMLYPVVLSVGWSDYDSGYRFMMAWKR